MADDLDRGNIKEAQAQAIKTARVNVVTPPSERHDHTTGEGPKLIKTTFGEG